MNYAVPSPQRFVTKKNIKKKRIITEEQKRRMDFIDSHKFTLSIDPETNKQRIDVHSIDET